MNILPLFINIFVPWMAFILVLGVSSFRLMYLYPITGSTLIWLAIAFWGACVALAVNRRRNDPDPAWYSYFAFAWGLAIFSAWLVGKDIFNNYSLPYYMIKDLKVLGHLDASKERGQNVMDAGIIYFADGNKIDAMRSWHFKQGSTYCVAPIIKGQQGKATPETQSFDFWAVGKDCCSTSSSDFRCGAYSNPLARSAIRILDPEDSKMYRLAVEQAETLYGVMAAHPVFVEWSQDPLEVVNSWAARGFNLYIMSVLGAFVVALLGVAVASSNYAWMGRAENIYDEAVNGGGYNQGGYNSAMA